MFDHLNPLLACNYTEEELQIIKNIRKFFANKEQNKTISKDERKECQKWIKASSILDDYFWGKGRCVVSSRNVFAAELEIYFRILLNVLDTNTEKEFLLNYA